MRCSSCSHENRDTARFCEACGASLAAVDGSGARKVVAIVFADLMGSTALHERLDPETVRRFMERYYAAMSAAALAHGGRVTQQLGDGVKAVFGIPRVAEDDAIRAVRAAVEMQHAFRALAEEQAAAVGKTGLRIAVNSGEVVVTGEREIIGDPVNVAAHLQAQARDGDVVIGEATQRLVATQVTLAPLGRFTLKGREEPVAAFRVASLERPAGVAATAFLGRDAELDRIMRVYEAVVAAPGARLAVVVGSPGLGKSRLLGEFAQRLGGGAAVLAAQCNAAGGATFAPLADALRRHLGLEAAASADALQAVIAERVHGDGAERARVAKGIAGLLTGAPAVPEETFFVVRRLLAALAAERPLVLAIDDIQWAEPLLLDLTEHLVVWGAGVRLLVLAAARPELRDARSSLASPGGVVADVITLGGLDAGAAAQLAANVIGAAALPAAIAGRVLATSEGNPLFLGELVRMLVNDGVLRRDGERWTLAGSLAELEMPPTIQALLAARIERLRPEDRRVLERAAVVGRQFSRAAVAHLLPQGERAELDARLESLRRSELIESDAGWLFGEPVLRFHHVLIRDAAYRRLLRRTRAELHARFADWLEQRTGAALHGETIGWHLESAHQQLRELGPLDADGRALGERAARQLAAAGRRALARDDLTPAGNLLGRALALLDPADPARADVALDCCEALLAAGDVGRAGAAVGELERSAKGSPRLLAWHTCFVGQLALLTDPQGLRTTTDAVAGAAETLAAAGDAAGEAKAYAVHALSLAQLGKIGASEASLDRALAAARRARDRRRANAVLAGAPVAALWGPSPVTRASGRCLDVVRVLRITQSAPAVEAVALRCQAVLETLRGRADAARRMIASSRRMVEELGVTQRVLEADLFAGLIELLEGDAAAAERWLRPAYEGLRAQSLDVDAAQAAALLGRALLAQGRIDEAEACSRESEALAGDSFKAAIAWRGVRSEARAARGDHAGALELARAAVEIAAATDDLLDHADARQSLAVALRAAGRGGEADAEARRAIELWDAKGATQLAERANARLGRAATPMQARARVDAPPVAAAAGPARRVRANRATANAARMDAAVAARDLAAFTATLAEGTQQVHHPTGSVYEERVRRAYEMLLDAEGRRFEHEPIATLGDALALCRTTRYIESSRYEDTVVGATDHSSVALLEVDGDGLRTRTEFFALDRTSDAVARLYERRAEQLPPGAERVRAETTARVVTALLGPYDLAHCAAVLHDDVVGIDRRRIGFGSARGKDGLLLALATAIEVSDDLVGRVDDVVAASPDALLLRWIASGTDRASGGRFEWSFLRLLVFGADGLLSAYGIYDSDHEDEALRDLETHSVASPPSRFVNGAMRGQLELERAWRERRWEDVVASFRPDFVLIDRRGLGFDLVGDAFIASLERLFAMPESRWQFRLIATRGETCALIHALFSAGGASRIDVENLALVERDAEGRGVRLVVFDPDDFDAAYADLGARYAAGEGAPHAELLAHLLELQRAAGTLDVPALERLLPPGFRFRSHRRYTNDGAWLPRDGFLASLAALRKLGTRSQRLRLHHLRVSAHAVLADATRVGTREGGAFELPQIDVLTHDGQRVQQLEVFDEDQVDAAVARFHAGKEAPHPQVAESMRAFQRALAARDWGALAACSAPELVVNDHRRLGWEPLHGPNAYVSALRALIDLAPDTRMRLDHVSICARGYIVTTVWVGHRDGGAFEEPSWMVAELDADARIVRFDQYEMEQQEAAWKRFAELERSASAN
jgi:class 3 adenylate cyclase/tetratricopeptide (TPR) repeat protein